MPFRSQASKVPIYPFFHDLSSMLHHLLFSYLYPVASILHLLAFVWSITPSSYSRPSTTLHPFSSVLRDVLRIRNTRYGTALSLYVFTVSSNMFFVITYYLFESYSNRCIAMNVKSLQTKRVLARCACQAPAIAISSNSP